MESVREVVNCNKLNKVISVSSYRYRPTAPTALGIREEVEQLGLTFLADRTNGRAIATLFRLSVRLSVCPSVRL